MLRMMPGSLPHERREVAARAVERVEQRGGRLAAVDRRAVADQQVLGQERLQLVGRQQRGGSRARPRGRGRRA